MLEASPLPEQRCELIESCPFFQTFGDRNATFWQSQLASYCFGPLNQHCRRRNIVHQTGIQPPLNVFPAGEMPESFLTIR